MGKGGRRGSRIGNSGGSRNPKRRATTISGGHKHDNHDSMMDDEIDAFHKQRDIIPLDVDGDVEGSDEDDDELPVFDLKGADGEEEEVEDDDEEEEDDTQLRGLAAKIARKKKDLLAKSGGVEDEMHDDTEEEEDKRAVWGRRKNIYYGADNVDYELQSSDEDPALEEADALRLQKEKAKQLSLEDFGLDDGSQSESDREPTMEEIRGKEKKALEAPVDLDAHDDHGVAYEVVKKDLTSLSKEEQMDVVHSSAPELVNLLSQLNDAVVELDNKVNPLLSKVKDMGTNARGVMHYMEIKQLLLLAYCQAITFFLLLKSEGQPVRDHPVIARLTEIKILLDKMKLLNLPIELEDLLTKKQQIESAMKLDDVTLTSHSSMNSDTVLCDTLGEAVVGHEAALVVKVDSSLENEKKGTKSKNMTEQVGVQSLQMLKVRAALEEKLKQNGRLSSIALKSNKVQKHPQVLNGLLMTLADFDDDDATDKSKKHAMARNLSKFSQINKPKIISGDDDLPSRDDIGERRRKHELRVLAGAGIQSMDDDNADGDEIANLDSGKDIDMAEDHQPEPEDDFYEQVKQQKAAKIAAKEEKYSRASGIPFMPEESLVDGKRHISSQMEKNRGLTRPRKKLIKNPRKKYKLKHQKAVVRRKGQVRDIRKSTSPYGGEASGINAAISRSIRF